MQAREKLSAHLRSRIIELSELKREGRKVIGYLPGGYMPEELVYACEAVPVPVGLFRGGEHEPVLVAGAYLPRWIDTFCRAQIGYKVLKEEPLYDLIDLLVVPITDNNVRAIADCWNFYTDVEVFRYGVPHAKTENGFRYYLEGLHLLKQKLEKLTGTKITDSRLKDAIRLCNEERRLFQEISLMRKAKCPPLTGREFVELNHASFLIDKGAMVEILRSLCSELSQQESSRPRQPRILLTGSTLALGDYKVYDLVENTGGAIVVAEEFAEGMRHFSAEVSLDGDLMEALADCYFRRRIPPAWFRPARERLDYLIRLSREFDVDGVIWYQLMYRDSYDIESFYFPRILKEETGLSMLKIASDYDASELGPFRTRIETFIQIIRKN
jgi:benzoyl-CoA reductase/2-hydroxyglutaryl-CoA dehydratase subunit BcrC/BadD/HgdB